MIVGREREIKTLNRMLNSTSSELIAVYGRRRVGKTYLIREVYKEPMVFEVTGLYKGNKRDQLSHFYRKLQGASPRMKGFKVPKNWFEAFEQLAFYLNGLKSKKKKVIFIDEFPWMATARSNFLMAFENFWNDYCTRRRDLVVVICGSAASYMVNKIIKNKGGLHNRLSSKIRLEPFSLGEMELFLKRKGGDFTRYDILQLYMVLGGVPQYINMLDKEENVPQNIDRLCFAEGGDLTQEFSEVFTSLFSNSKRHELIVRTLAQANEGVTRRRLLELCKIGSGGLFSTALEELIESGFVSAYAPIGRKKKEALFRLTDEYCRFYLKYIEDNVEHEEGAWEKYCTRQSYKSWSGFALEALCLKHVPQIKKALGIERIYSVHSSWHNEKAQIDLVIDRDDRVINLCEIKFYDEAYTLTKASYSNIKNKVSEFKKSNPGKKSISVVIISPDGMKPNKYSKELKVRGIESADLFL